MPYLPHSEPNIQRPTPDEVYGRIAEVQAWQAAIAKAKAASFCPGGTIWNGNRWVTIGDGTVGAAIPGANYQGGGGQGPYDQSGGQNPSGLTDEQLQDLADAPVIISPANEPCVGTQEVVCNPPSVSAPPWGNQRGAIPQPVCAPGGDSLTAASIMQQASDLPWWVMALIIGGGILAVREVLD